MALVLASTKETLPHARRHVRSLGMAVCDVLEPGKDRRLLVAPVDDQTDGARLVAQLRAEGHSVVLRPDGGPQLDAWIRHTRPVAIDPRLTVCFVWSEHDRRAMPGVVEIDPDGGFGSGSHPATRLLLEELARRVHGGERVLDVGCGSGVLGLSALRLGATGAVGVDLEPSAIECTARNAALNGLSARMEASLTSLEALDGTFDVVLANVGRAAIVDLAPQLVARVAPGGWLAVAGFSPPQSEVVAAVLQPLGVVSCRAISDWGALVVS